MSGITGCVRLGVGGGGVGVLVYWGLTPQQQPGSYQGGEMKMKSVFWWRELEYSEETTDLRQVTVGEYVCRCGCGVSVSITIPYELSHLYILYNVPLFIPCTPPNLERFWEYFPLSGECSISGYL